MDWINHHVQHRKLPYYEHSDRISHHNYTKHNGLDKLLCDAYRQSHHNYGEHDALVKSPCDAYKVIVIMASTMHWISHHVMHTKSL